LRKRDLELEIVVDRMSARELVAAEVEIAVEFAPGGVVDTFADKLGVAPLGFATAAPEPTEKPRRRGPGGLGNITGEGEVAVPAVLLERRQ
jgi:hypothetical protein